MSRKENIVSVTAGMARPDYKSLTHDSKTYTRDFRNAMYFIHYEIADKQLKTEFIKFLKSKKDVIANIDVLDNYYFAIAGKPCVVLNRGGQVTGEWIAFLSSETERLRVLANKLQAEKDAEKEEADKKKPAPTIQDRLKEKAGYVASTYDGWIDEFILDPVKFKPETYDPLKEMQAADLKAPHVRFITSFYENDIAEIEKVVKNADDDLSEAYASFTKPQLKKLLKLYEKITLAANLITETSAVQRKPRVRKAPDKTKQVSNLKFQESDKVLGLVSINPVDIIGATELWVYNTKTRKLGKYIAADEKVGLDVKGASVLAYADTSVEKTLRKPDEQIKEFKAAGKVALRKFMDTIKSVDTKLKGRINENHILLKVVK